MFAGTIEEYGQACRAEGLTEGYAEGFAEGEAEAMATVTKIVRRAVVRELTNRFGDVPECLVLGLDATTDVERLERLFNGALKVSSLEEFEAILA